jgi:23S rRNA (adenine2503-C2)-methyltransferase
MSDPRPCLQDLSVAGLRARFAEAGVEPWRAEQVAAWLWARGVTDPAAWTDLPAGLRARLAGDWRTRALALERVERSADGTLKARLATADGDVVEAVVIPEAGRTTLCLSTQVGCPLACAFCATGALGFRRNLSSGEILDQVLHMRALLESERRITNVVFMGMGEPLLNLPAVVDAARVLLHPKAFGFAPRRVTVSTAGLAPKIPELLEAVPVNLAVSLHAATDAVRDWLVPLNRRFPLAVLMETLRGLPRLGPRRPVFFEYTLIEGVNDAPADARAVAARVRGLPAKVNVIPMNPHPASPFRPPAPQVAERFLGELAARGVTVTLRKSRGADIAAACGQLAGRAPGRRFVKRAAGPAEDAAGGPVS